MGRGIRSVRWGWWLIGVLVAAALYQAAPTLYPRSIRGSEAAAVPHGPGDTLPAISFFPVSRWSGAFFDWRGRRLDGLSEGRCVVLGFFLSTCPACEPLASGWTHSDEIEIGSESLPFFWVGRITDRGARAWLERHSFQNAFLVRPAGFAAFQVNFVPQVYVVSPDGVLLHRGLLSEAELTGLEAGPASRLGDTCGVSQGPTRPD